MSENTPPLTGVLETVLYFSDEARAAAFYGGILGFRRLDREPGRSLFYRAGSSVFLLFDAQATRLPGKLPPHGCEGPGHTCFLVPPDSYARWKAHLEGEGVGILGEMDWPKGRSFYFRDPDGNLLEIADADIWPR